MSDSNGTPGHQLLIDSNLPTHWQDLEEHVGLILGECGFHVEVQASVQSARGSVEFDVYARDWSAALPTVLAVECKLWDRPVPQCEVHRFRTTVADVGANVGFLVSSKGYQSGALEAAAYTNIRLATWEEFQSTFAERWYQKFMLNVIRAESRRLIGRSFPGGSLLHELFWHPKETHEKAMDLAAEHAKLTDFASTLLWFKGAVACDEPRMLRPPLRSSLGGHFERWSTLPDDVLDAPALRPLLTALQNHFRQAISKFDAILS